MKNLIIRFALTAMCFTVMIFALVGCDGTFNGINGANDEVCNHQYGNWTTEYNYATKCEDRTYERVCVLCQNVETRNGTFEDHAIQIIVESPTCGDSGYVLEKCTLCEYANITECMDPTGEHKWGEGVTIPSTCIQDGYILSMCYICGWAELVEKLPRADHVWTQATVDATCVSNGMTYNICTVCKEITDKTVFPALTGHDYRLNSDAGYHWQYCEICDVRINVKSHSFDSDNTCSICGYEKAVEKQLVTLWVSEISGMTELVSQQIERFLEANPKYAELYTFEVMGVTEADAASHIVADISCAPDIYCFTQDQLARLVQANALARPNNQIANSILLSNDKISIKAASHDGTIYAYPMTTDNGYYMYYDKSVISEEDLDSMEALLDACYSAGKTFRYPGCNAWYNAGFFIATGCHSQWTINEECEFISVDDTYNSPEGLIAMKGLQKMTQHPAYNPDNDGDLTNAAIVISGVWAINSIKEVFGENYAATDLPSFTIDGQSYHLGSYTGNKLMGVKPQDDSAKAEMLSKLAEYLTGSECQLDRYEQFMWCPSNLEAQASDTVKSNQAVAALNLQNEYAVAQGIIHGSWWDIAAELGQEAMIAYDESDLEEALNNYSVNLLSIFNTSDEEAWSVIGNICGTVWDVDFPMTEVSDNVFESEIFTLYAGEEFKVRRGASWQVYFGSNGKQDGPNCVVEANGSYIIRLTLHSLDFATIELIPQ